MALPGNMNLEAFGDLVTRARKGTATIDEMRQLPVGYWVKPNEYFFANRY